MKRKCKLSTALDIDDVLMECTAYAVKLANEKYKFDPRCLFMKSNNGASKAHART